MGFENCIQRINQAAGRELTDDELADIMTRVNREVAALAKTQGFTANGMPDLRALPPGIVREAAEKAARELLHEAQKKRQRVALTIIKHDEIKAEIARHATVSDGLGAVLERVDGHAHAVYKSHLAKLIDTLTATNPSFFGLIEDGMGIRALVREMFGERTGNKVAADGAKAWAETAEMLRQRFNRAGGDVGKLDNWGMPQSHDMRLVREAGQGAWVDYVMQRIDRTRYVRDDGMPMTDAAIRELLGAAWKTISTDGISKIKPGQVRGKGMRANRGSESRVIHFKDADAWLDYHTNFSGRGVFNTLTGHVMGISRDIALVERFGPNSGRQFQYWRDVAEKAGASGTRLNFLENFYGQLDGSANAVVDPRVARAWQGLRNLTVASKLTGAVLSSVTDFATAAVTAGFNHLPPLRFARNIITSLNPLNKDDVRLAQRAGLGLETLIAEANRWGDDSMGAGWSSRLASVTMRASGLDALTEANRRAFGVTMAATLGDLTQVDWARLKKQDKAQLTHYGITSKDWAILKQAQGEDWGGANTRVLTVASIRQLTDAQVGAEGAAAQRIRDTLSTKVLDMVLAETNFAVVTPGAKERAFMMSVRGGQKGTWSGELARTMWLFKSFPIAMISKHWMRGWGMETAGGKAAYLASLAIGTTVLGALAMQLKDVTKGKEPRDMTTPEFWGAAFAQGGGVGIFGDYLFSDQSRFGRSINETVAGPVLGGMTSDLYDLTVGKIHQAGRGEDTHFGAEALKFAQYSTPLINLWYTRAMLDRVVFQQMQEYLSPGYLQKVRERSQEQTGQDYWNMR